MTVTTALAGVCALCAVACAALAWRTHRWAERIGTELLGSDDDAPLALVAVPPAAEAPAPAPAPTLGVCVVCGSLSIVVGAIDVSCMRCQRRWTGPVCPQCATGPVPLASKHPGCLFGWRFGAVA